MKIYIHEGPGYYIGSTVVVVSENIETAEKLIRASLDKMGLCDEKLSIVEINIKKNSVVYTASGDY